MGSASTASTVSTEGPLPTLSRPCVDPVPAALGVGGDEDSALACLLRVHSNPYIFRCPKHETLRITEDTRSLICRGSQYVEIRKHLIEELGRALTCEEKVMITEIIKKHKHQRKLETLRITEDTRSLVCKGSQYIEIRKHLNEGLGRALTSEEKVMIREIIKKHQRHEGSKFMEEIMMREREAEIEVIREGCLQLNELSQRINTLVNDQGRDIQIISSKIDSTNDLTKGGLQNIKMAQKEQCGFFSFYTI